MSRTRFAPVGALMACVVLAAAGCSFGVPPAPPTVRETEPPTAPDETWPGPTAGLPSEEPTSEAPSSEASTPDPPAATAAPLVAPTPRVTPEPTLPPVTPPWTLDGSIAPDDLDTEHWSWGTSDVLLANGDVLLVNNVGRQAAIRDAGSGAWRIVTGLPAVRTGFGFVALEDGSALAVGGLNGDGVSFSSVYRFDPVATAWRKIGLLEWARSYPGVALLPDGRVLVAGGSFLNGERADASSVVLAAYPGDNPAGVEFADIDVPEPVAVPYATVEIFDPGTGTSVMARPMACARGGPGVATLADGRIMVTDLVEPGCGAAEIYDPATGSFTKTGELPPLDLKALARQGVHPYGGGEPSLGSPVALGDGGALLGLEEWQKHGQTIFRSFRFHPATNGWTQFGPTAAVVNGEAEWEATKWWSMQEAELVPLDDGRVFIVGGSVPQAPDRGGWVPVLTTRIFDPVRSELRLGADLPGEMTVSAALQLRDGSVLLVGQFGETWTDPPLTAIRYVFDSSN